MGKLFMYIGVIVTSGFIGMVATQDNVGAVIGGIIGFIISSYLFGKSHKP